MRTLALDFLDPADFPDAEAAREFVRGDLFAALVAAAREALLGAEAHPDLAGGDGERALRAAREGLWYALGDLRELATVAAGPGGPLRAEAAEEADAERPARLAAVARVAACVARQGAPEGQWRPLLDLAARAHGPRP